MISKMILASNDYGCSEEVITIAAVLSIQVIISFCNSSAEHCSVSCSNLSYFLTNLALN